VPPSTSVSGTGCTDSKVITASFYRFRHACFHPSSMPTMPTEPDARISPQSGQLSGRPGGQSKPPRCCPWKGPGRETAVQPVCSPLSGTRTRKVENSSGLMRDSRRHGTRLFFRFNRRPISQAGRRGFDLRLPLFFFSNLQPSEFACSPMQPIRFQFTSADSSALTAPIRLANDVWV
jgi:hypothetical protein